VTSGFSRIPVYKGSEDNIVGLVYAKDLLELMNKKNGSNNVRVSKLMRTAPIFPETKKIDELLREMQKKKQHMAIMVDEYGDVAGIVTIEDIIEEIVGEIRDEFDREEEPVEIIDESHAIVDGALNLDEVNDRFDLELVEEDADTLAGLVIALFGKIPKEGEAITWSDEHTEVEFTVEQMDRNRIEKVRLEVVKREPVDEEGGEVVEESALV
ncbi:MAG: transporter associated domain-containing protein, partial [Candidatus Undinarchaeales archaeon]|nr:transporter associated domain-containing protein [Candidatus Undinarchaeales archaeon]